MLLTIFGLNTIQGESWDTKLCLHGPPTNERTSWHPRRFATATKREEGKGRMEVHWENNTCFPSVIEGEAEEDESLTITTKGRQDVADQVGEACSEPRAGNEEGSGGWVVRDEGGTGGATEGDWLVPYEMRHIHLEWRQAAGAWRRAHDQSQWEHFSSFCRTERNANSSSKAGDVNKGQKHRITNDSIDRCRTD